MNLNLALSVLAKANLGSTMTRPGGLTVRLAIGEEGRLHRYVFDGPFGPEVFDAEADDLAATDWEVAVKPRDTSGPRTMPKTEPEAKPTKTESETAKK
jgi:hypothetical protein